MASRFMVVSLALLLTHTSHGMEDPKERSHSSYKKLLNSLRSPLTPRSFSQSIVTKSKRLPGKSPFLLLTLGTTIGAALYKHNVSTKSQGPQGLEIIVEGTKKAQETKDKDVIFFLGNKRNGKSTTMAYLMGAKFRIDEEDGTDVAKIVEDDGKTYPKIGHTATGETVYPEVFSNNGYYLCDCPGFFDNGDFQQKLVTSVSRELALKAAKSRKIVLVSDYAALSAEGSDQFLKTTKLLSELFKPHDDQSIDEISKSILWVITKVPELEDPITLPKVIKKISAALKYLGGKKKDIEDLILLAKGLPQSESKFEDIAKILSLSFGFSKEINAEQATIKEQERLENEQKIIEGIAKDSPNARIMLITLNDLLDRKKRREIADHLKALPPITIETFNFDEEDLFRKEFKKESESYMNEGIKTLTERSRITQGINELDRNMKNLEERIKACEEGILGHLGSRDKIIKTYSEERDHNTFRVEEIAADIEDLERKLKDIDTAEPVLVYSKIEDEKRSSWLSLNWSKFYFSYEGSQPIMEPVEDFDRRKGQMSRTGTDLTKGVYKGVYTGNWKRDARVSVKISAQKNLLHGHVPLIQGYKNHLGDLKREKGKLERRNKALNELIEKSEKKQMDVEAFKNKKEQCVQDKKKLENEKTQEIRRRDQLEETIKKNKAVLFSLYHLTPYIKSVSEGLTNQFCQAFPLLYPPHDQEENPAQTVQTPTGLANKEISGVPDSSKKKIHIHSATWGGIGPMRNPGSFKLGHFEEVKPSDKKDYKKFQNFFKLIPKDQESFEFEVNKGALGNPCWGGAKTLKTRVMD